MVNNHLKLRYLFSSTFARWRLHNAHRSYAMYYDIHEAQLRTAEIARDADDVDYKFCEITVPLTKKATEYHSSLEVVEKQPIAYNIPTANPMQFLVPIVFGRDDPKFLRHFVGTIYLLPFGKVG